MSLAVVENYLEEPAHRGELGFDQAGWSVTVFDPLEATVPRAAVVRPICLVRLEQANARRVFGHIFVEDGVALVVVALADQPTEYTRRIGRIGYTALCRFAVEGGDVVSGDRAPVRVAIAPACPSFDAGEEALYARTVTTNNVVLGLDRAGNDVGFPSSVDLCERRHQVFCPRQDEHVGYFGISIPGQTLVSFAGDGWNR